MMGDNLIPDSAVKAIQDSQKAEVLAVDGASFVTKEVFLPPRESQAATLQIHTLSGLVAYLTKDVDKLDEDETANGPVYVYVVSPTQVDVLGPPQGRHQSRPHPVLVMAYPAKPKLNQYIPLEDAIINLQTAFVDTDQRAGLLRVLGNVTDEKVNSFKDDGISQSVTAKKGLSLAETVAVPNPLLLSPYRTFVEVEQPASLFVIRLKENNGQPPYVMLAEADGGAWQNEATKNIAEYLNDHLDGKATVIY
jgi:hypothetical protein